MSINKSHTLKNDSLTAHRHSSHFKTSQELPLSIQLMLHVLLFLIVSVDECGCYLPRQTYVTIKQLCYISQVAAHSQGL